MTERGDVRTFYDDLAPLYHLVYENWDASVTGQGGALASIIAERWGADARAVLDGAVGIGTQALGLLYTVSVRGVAAATT